MAEPVIMQCQICGAEAVWHRKGRKTKYCKDCLPEVNRRRAKEWQRQKRNYYNRYMQRYYEDADNHLKHLVRLRTNRMIRAGKIIPQTKCAICGAADDLQNHHISYNLPLCEYAVVTLCRGCHTSIHSGNDNR